MEVGDDTNDDERNLSDVGKCQPGLNYKDSDRHKVFHFDEDHDPDGAKGIFSEVGSCQPIVENQRISNLKETSVVFHNPGIAVCHLVSYSIDVFVAVTS